MVSETGELRWRDKLTRALGVAGRLAWGEGAVAGWTTYLNGGGMLWRRVWGLHYPCLAEWWMELASGSLHMGSVMPHPTQVIPFRYTPRCVSPCDPPLFVLICYATRSFHALPPSLLCLYARRFRSPNSCVVDDDDSGGDDSVSSLTTL